ncbi:MAG: glycine--tRNA ligase subunit beta [Acidobacteriota bacterium]|nr:glycine--tRNA ligase subunit beta [Acidobacteriota bacterium]
MSEFFLEIITEEMPSSHVKTALEQLQANIKKELLSQNVDVVEIMAYGTCRRLVVVGDFALSQKDSEEEITGPPKSVAFKPDGSPTAAAIGFCKSQGVSVDELQVIRTERGEYVGVKKIIKGRETQDILSDILPSVIKSISFPKMMHWGKNTLKFSRPIKNILCLFDHNPVSFKIAWISSGAFTIGHKILSPDRIRIDSFSDYKKALKKNKVVFDQAERKKIILTQIQKKLAPLEAQIFPDEQLLDKLLYDVECPYVFIGAFPEKYLKLPIEVLSAAMKAGQNLFSVVRGKRQIPYFLGVADSGGDHKEIIRKGNERVLKARLEDAKFFWEQDLKVPLEEKAAQLSHIIFQEKLGTYADKAERLKKISAYLSDKLEIPKEKKQVMKAGELCKVDLLTEMVRELPSLQGKIGGLYARKEGCHATIWKAIYEHYQPNSLDEPSPLSIPGAIISIADKIDSIVGVVGIGIEVTGSKDPFGMRRNAQGICKIILEKRLNISLMRLMDKVITVYDGQLEKEKSWIKSYCLAFFRDRLQYIFEREGYRYDLINAALSPGIDNIYYSFLRLKALDSLKKSPQFEPMILIAKRVNNILRDQPAYKINPELLTEKEERELYSSFMIIKENVLPMIAKGDFLKAQKIIFQIRSSINNFFDNVLVMTEDKRTKKNRLALLQAISKLLMNVADYSQIVIEG